MSLIVKFGGLFALVMLLTCMTCIATEPASRQEPSPIVLGHQGQVTQITTICTWCDYTSVRTEGQVQSQPQSQAPVQSGSQAEYVWVIAPTELQRNGFGWNGDKLNDPSEKIDGFFDAALRAIGIDPVGMTRFYPEGELSYYPSGQDVAQKINKGLSPSMTLDEIQSKVTFAALDPSANVLVFGAWGSSLARMTLGGKYELDQNGDIRIYDAIIAIYLTKEGETFSKLFTRGTDTQFLEINPR
jgi:hypothetical protein